MTTVLLFDMDGVLLTPGGYHRALQATVAHLGRCLGFPDATIIQEQIHRFEAMGITNEWDSAAICLAVMAESLWETAPGREISPALLQRPLPVNGRPAPDFDAVLERLERETPRTEDPVTRARAVLPEAVHGFLLDAYSPEGLSHRVQQEHVLGTEEFRSAYGLPGLLGVESYLLRHDRTNLGGRDQARLAGWIAGGGAAVIFTNRPTRSPDGRLGTPEGELGARLVGLEGLPLAGSGGVVWLEDRFGVPAGRYNKPHPLHALAALQMALGVDAGEAFLAARALVEGEGGRDLWAGLDNSETWVFEDSTAGISSLRIAKEFLARVGVRLQLRLVGVTDSRVKRRALEEAGAQVQSSLSDALRPFFESQGL